MTEKTDAEEVAAEVVAEEAVEVAAEIAMEVVESLDQRKTVSLTDRIIGDHLRMEDEELNLGVKNIKRIQQLRRKICYGTD